MSCAFTAHVEFLVVLDGCGVTSRDDFGKQLRDGKARKNYDCTQFFYIFFAFAHSL